tara:strand:+ start:302 stop:589 length:288 start_codon:yes stop_codon:yes gene_type:complete
MGSRFKLEDTNIIELNNYQWMSIVHGLQCNILQGKKQVNKRIEMFIVDKDPKDQRAVAAHKDDIKQQQAIMKIIRDVIFTDEEREYVSEFSKTAD